MNSSFSIREAAKIDSPALIVFPDIVKENIQLAIKMAGKADRLRPHVKTHKSPQVTRLMLDAGIQKFKCATIAEAEMLGREKARDVLISYSLVGPKVRRFIQLIQSYPQTKFSCLIDNPDIAKQAELAFNQAGLRVHVYIDLNTGMNRTGIMPDESAVELYRYLTESPCFMPAGIHAYDGHIRHPHIEERRKLCDAGFEMVTQFQNKLQEKGLPVPAIIVGGSPTFPIHADRKDVECSPGTFVYWDRGYQTGCPEQGFQCAAILLTRVISHPTGQYYCLDLGHKSVAAENEISRRVYFPDLPDWPAVSQSEEHLVIAKPENAVKQLIAGDVLYGIPWHICPTVALYEKVICIEKGEITGTWENWARVREF